MPREAAELVFDEATKVYPGRDGAAVDHLSLTVPAGEICVLVGPSGGGKTTALKLVNRLIPLTSGDIRIDGTSILEQDVVQLRRSIGYVIQQVGLFPHMTVEANIGTVPRLYRRPRAWIKTRSAELLELVGLDPSYAKQFPGAALRRRAPARRPRARARSEPAADADGRAVRRDRPDRPRAAAGRVPPPPARRCARRSSSSHTTSTRRSRSATASPSSARADGSPSTTRREQILDHPVDDFVADFVGRDRALKALALRTLGELELAPATGTACRGCPRTRASATRSRCSSPSTRRAGRHATVPLGVASVRTCR